MDAEFSMQPGDQLFIFDRGADVTLEAVPGGTHLNLDGPDGEWSATIYGVPPDDAWGGWLFWG